MIGLIKRLFVKKAKESSVSSGSKKSSKKTYKKSSSYKKQELSRYKGRQSSYKKKVHQKSSAKKINESENIKIDFVNVRTSQPDNSETYGDIPKQIEGKKRFFDFKLPPAILRTLNESSFSYCTPIQEEVFEYSLEGQDLVGKAETGTGKTIAFLVSVYSYLINNSLEKQFNATPRCVIMAPTRELAIQIGQEAELLGKYADVNILCVYGGVKYTAHLQSLESRVDILVGTPGRLMDYRRRGWLDLKKTEVLVIDEADRMLDMGFIRDIQRIIVDMPLKKNRFSLLFSATYDEKIKSLFSQFLRSDYRYIEPDINENKHKIEQIVYTMQEANKVPLILWYLENDSVERMVIFVNLRTQVGKLTKKLMKKSVKVGSLSSDVRQAKRQQVLKDFENKKINVIVATDVMGRGIHIDDISHVINYDLPYEAEDYVHRIGRTGRAGKTGKAISFACESSAFELPAIEAYIDGKLACQTPLPEMLEFSKKD